MDRDLLNQRLLHVGKYVFSPRSVFSFRTGRHKPYANFVQIEGLQERYAGSVDVTRLDPEEEQATKNPHVYGLIDDNTQTLPPTIHSPGSYVARLQGGWCHGRSCDWVGIGDHALADLRDLDGRLKPSHFPLGRLNPRYYRRLLTNSRRFPKPVHVPGRVVVLNKAASHNYFHWLSELMPRMDLVRRAGVDQTEAYVVDSYLRFQTQTLAALGIPKEKVIEPHDGLLLEADELIVPSLSSASARRRLGLRLMDALGLPVQRKPEQVGRRLFISRRKAKTRRLENERQVEELLAHLGFESLCLESCSLKEQVRLFSEASIVVGPHGAGLTNVMFCLAGAQVIEIMKQGYQRICYSVLSNELGHTHRVVFARSGRKRKSLHVPIEAIAEAVSDAEEDARKDSWSNSIQVHHHRIKANRLGACSNWSLSGLARD